MYQTIKTNCIRFHRSFRSSAVILIARLNVLLGAAYTYLLTVDPHMLGDLWPGFKDPRVIAAFVIANGVLTEYGRRRPRSLDPIQPVEPYQPTDNPLK